MTQETKAPQALIGWLPLFQWAATLPFGRALGLLGLAVFGGLAYAVIERRGDALTFILNSPWAFPVLGAGLMQMVFGMLFAHHIRVLDAGHRMVEAKSKEAAARQEERITEIMKRDERCQRDLRRAYEIMARSNLPGARDALVDMQRSPEQRDADDSEGMPWTG